MKKKARVSYDSENGSTVSDHGASGALVMVVQLGHDRMKMKLKRFALVTYPVHTVVLVTLVRRKLYKIGNVKIGKIFTDLM